MSSDGFAGAIFDVDGVLVDSPHERAWKDSLRALMEGEWADIAPSTTWSPEAFTSKVYQEQMSGKPRDAGATSALEYFGVPDVATRAKVYGAHKQDMVVRLIEAGEFRAYPDALRFVLACKGAGLRIAAASSSKNAGLFLKQIRLDTFAEENGLSYGFLTPGLSLLDSFDVDISGRDFAHGKPAPDIFLAAAEELGYLPSQVFVVEDAVSGVQAAKAGDMSAVGVSRADDFDALAAQHADIVVKSLDEIDVSGLGRHELVGRPGVGR
ncbi:MAG: HAD-IA family hydrolase [Pseudonocardia sp.]|nr:HAD-IA family hydrolase [Pseudonocardia sp.]